MASKLFFNGQSYSTPTTVTAVDDTAEAPANLTVGNTLAYIGVADGGQPGKVYSFGDPSQVAPALTSGPLCSAAIKAFNPSNDEDVQAPGLVKCIRVGTATPNLHTLLDVHSNPSIIVTDASYGTTGPVPLISVEAGTNPNTLLVEVQEGQSYVTQDNLGGALFTATYTGAAASAEINTSGTAVVLEAPNGTVLATLNLGQFSVVQDIVDWINSHAGFSATITAGETDTLVMNLLDTTSYSIKAVTAPVTGNLAAVLAWLNGPAQSFVTAVAAAPTAGVLLPPAPVAPTYLSGGTNPTVVIGDYINALTILQGQDVQWVVPLSGDPAVWAAVDAHVQYMSTIGKSERRAFVGPPAGTSMTAVEAMPINVNSDRTAICWPGYYDYDVNGNLVLLDPFYTAAVVAAGFAGANPGEPMTNKSFTFRGLEVDVRNPTDTDVLIQAGVMCFDQEPTGYMCVRSVSTWLDNNNFNRVEVSTGAATDFMVRNVRQALDVLKGQRGDPRIIGRAITIADTALRQLAKPPPQGPGVIVGDANNPAYRGITASLDGDVLSVSFEASPVIPVNFIPISIAITPYSGTATSTAAASTLAGS